MKKILWLVLVSLLLLPGWIHAQEETTRHLELLENKYSRLKDYTVDVNVHFDIEGFKTPDMQARIYYKIPDKMKVESKKVFFFPKEAGFFHPSMFKREEFDIKLLDRLNYEGRRAVRLKLISKETKKSMPAFVLIIDTERNLILEMSISSIEGREGKAILEYGKSNEFDLPRRIELQLDIPFDESVEIKDFGHSSQKAKRVKGKVEITYSNYKVNSGLSDEIFKETGFMRAK